MLEPKWLRTSKTQVVCKTWELRNEGFRPSFSHPRGMVAGLLLGYWMLLWANSIGQAPLGKFPWAFLGIQVD